MNPGKVDKKSMRFLLLFILSKWRSSLIDICHVTIYISVDDQNFCR